MLFSYFQTLMQSDVKQRDDIKRIGVKHGHGMDPAG